MKKAFLALSFVAIAFCSNAQDSPALKREGLLNKLQASFSGGWKLDLIEPSRLLRWDTMSLPPALLRANLSSNELTETVTVYFFDIAKKDSALHAILKDALGKRIKEYLKAALTDSDYVADSTDYGAGFNQNEQFFAISFFNEEETYEILDAKFTKEMNMPEPEMQIKLVEIKQEEKKIIPPPPPPPRQYPPKGARKKEN